MPLRIDLGSLLERQAAAYPENRFIKLVDEPNWWTYAAFNTQANRLAHGLLALGVAKGDYVAVMLDNCMEFVSFSYATKKIGAVEVAVNTEFRGVGLTRLLNLTGARILVTQAKYIDPLSDVLDDLASIASVIFIDEVGASPSPLSRLECLSLADMISDLTANPERCVVDSDVAEIRFSSGTSGLSKGLLQSHRQALRKAEGIIAPCEITAEDCAYSPWPLFHSGAAHYEVLGALMTGGRIVIRNRFSASGFWDEVRAHQATWFMVVGSVQAILCAAEPSLDDRSNPIRVAWGAPYTVPRQIFEERFDLVTVNGYGMEDVGYVSTTSLTDRGYGTVGKIRDDLYQIRIADEHDVEVALGESGEILIRPREPHSMMEGYFGEPERTREVFRNLWFHTGDLGKMDAEGNLYFHARLKEVIRRRGENVMPHEVEEVIQRHPAVGECLAVGVDSPVGEQDVKVYIILRDCARLEAEALRQWCEGRMARFMVPTHVEFVDDVPRTPTGKPALSQIGR